MYTSELFGTLTVRNWCCCLRIRVLKATVYVNLKNFGQHWEDSIERTDIGRWLEATFLSPVLNTGTTRAVFQREGYIPSLSILLNMWVNKFRINGRVTFSIFMEMPSSPVDFLLSISLLTTVFSLYLSLCFSKHGRIPGIVGSSAGSSWDLHNNGDHLQTSADHQRAIIIKQLLLCCCNEANTLC